MVPTQVSEGLGLVVTTKSSELLLVSSTTEYRNCSEPLTMNVVPVKLAGTDPASIK